MEKTLLIEMEIDTGNSLLITQNPYTLPLKHATWVQKELEILEKAGVIVKGASLWASPIVIVPKRTAQENLLKGDSAWIIKWSIVYYLL